MRFTALAVAALLTVAACSGSDVATEATTTTTDAVTTTLSPDAAFDAYIASNLSSPDPTLASSTNDLAHSFCDALDSTADAGTDAPNPDPTIGQAMQELAIGSALGSLKDLPENVPPIILRGASRYLCPDYETIVDDYLTDHGR